MPYFNLNVKELDIYIMKKIILTGLLILFVVNFVSASEVEPSAQGQEPSAYGEKPSTHKQELPEGMVNPGFYNKPDWFKQSFLDLQDDLDDANENNKHILLYFHQDGCPYCKKLLNDNFTRMDIIAKMKQHFDVLEVNMWGDKSVTTIAGEELSEKEFARQMKVMFTPTLIALDKKGLPEFRMNGYYAPDKFSAVLDYLLLEPENSSSIMPEKTARKHPGFNEYYRQQTQSVPGKGKKMTVTGLHTEKFVYMGNDFQTLINTSSKPIMILFEQNNCSECDELHGDIFRRLPVYKKLREFTIAQIDINSADEIIAPDGQTMSQEELAKKLNIQYAPSILFYENGNNSDKKPIFRSEAYLKSFHVQALLDYISSRAYLSEPEFQRFVQGRAEKMRAEGVAIELWE